MELSSTIIKKNSYIFSKKSFSYIFSKEGFSYIFSNKTLHFSSQDQIIKIPITREFLIIQEMETRENVLHFL